jgi:GNAT superfamily N-acetyltransferase
MAADIELLRVEGRRDLGQFVRFPWKVYARDRNWVPPLLSDRTARLDPARNPFFSHAQVAFFLARRRGRPVGTIAAFVDRQSVAHLGERYGGFGFFETEEDISVAEALVRAARDQILDWGMKGFRGPTNFGENDEPGVLLEGADCPPALLEAHTPPYYAPFLERCGMTRYRDLYAWRVPLAPLSCDPSALPAELLRVFKAAAARREVEVRKIQMADWDREVETARTLFNTTLEFLPESVPMDEHDFRNLANQMKPILDPDLALIIEAKGKPIGFLVALPDFNRVLLHLNGSLFPLGWVKLLWYSRRIDQVTFKLFGLLEAYRGRGIDALAYVEAVRTAARKGYKWLDGSVTSENNPTINRLAERLGAERYKHYRLYQMEFA